MQSKKRKGLSADDKRAVILRIYHERKDVLNLKEIENLASKLGVVQQTVKEHNQSLVDDGIVLSDKIGSSNFFWSFPSKAFQERAREKETLSASIDSTIQSIANIRSNINLGQQSRNAIDRKLKLEKFMALREQEKNMTDKLESLKMNDPEEIKRIESLAAINKAAADRWTDNIWNIKRFLTKKKGMSGKEVDKMLCIDSSFDYVNVEVPKPTKMSKNK